MGAPAKTLLTAEEFDNYPFEEDKRYELDEGELIETPRPSYWPNLILSELLLALKAYFRSNQTGRAFDSDHVYVLSPTTRRAPGIAMILGQRGPELRDAKVIPLVPDIACELLAADERITRLHRRLRQYLVAGVKEIWLVDPEDNTVEVWTGPELPGRLLFAGDSLNSPLLPGFAQSLEELFS